MKKNDIYVDLLKQNMELLSSPDDLKAFNIPRVKKVLVMSPHSDDEVIGCAGTILKLVENNIEVKIVYITSEEGDKGIIRKKEALLAWRDVIVGQEFWGYPDGFLTEHIKEFEYQLEQLLYGFQPDVIMLPWPVDSHSDHRSVFDAICNIHKKGVRIVCELFFYENYYPVIANHLVNITSVFEQKKSMLKCFESQSRLNIQEFTCHLNAYRAACVRIKK